MNGLFLPPPKPSTTPFNGLPMVIKCRFRKKEVGVEVGEMGVRVSVFLKMPFYLGSNVSSEAFHWKKEIGPFPGGPTKQNFLVQKKSQQ